MWTLSGFVDEIADDFTRFDGVRWVTPVQATSW